MHLFVLQAGTIVGISKMLKNKKLVPTFTHKRPVQVNVNVCQDVMDAALPLLA